MKTSSFAEVEERYASLTTEEFAAIDRASLTDDARAAYDEEATRRGLAESVARKSPEEQAVEAPEGSQYVGVRGWLLLLCLALAVFSPIVTIFFLVTNYQEAAQSFERFPGLRVISQIDILLSVGVMAFSVYAGVSLWRKKHNAVRIAKAYLWTYLGYSIVASGLPFAAGLPSFTHEAMIIEVLKNLFRSLLFFALWYSYLNGSKRVKATFPPGLSS
ncbi:MAG: DUF2569 domain-containing protein [Acidobacteriia bacterium]|nr:DUF2569 domain-containing protein [Terriglobia bacterium]